MSFRVALIVLSDRAASGERADACIPVMKERLGDIYSIAKESVMPDDPAALQAELIELADSHEVDLVLTSGGTGLSPRDRTPLAGVRHRTLIVNLPGSPRAVGEALDIVLPVIPHALALLNDCVVDG